MKKLDIVYEDKKIIVVNKPSKQLTIRTRENENNTLYNEVSAYVKKQYPRNKIFIVHRLDRDTSGLIIFAKDEQTKYELQNHWDKVNREYYCIVEGIPKEKKATLKNYLQESKTLEVYIAKTGKLAITEYEVLKSNKNYSLLKVKIKTGRKNQIRVQLANINNPIVGDKKYKSKTNPIGRLCLHAYKINYTLKGKTYNFESKYPKEFTKIINI